MSALVSLIGVSKRYRTGDRELRAADDISLEIEQGTSTALIGSSGSGKSTLLHLIGAIDVPDSGSINVGGLDLTKLGRRASADYRAGIGFVFQQFHLLPALTLADNVSAPLVARRGVPDRRARAVEMLAAVGLGDRVDSRPDQLSGGQQQRVAIARALVVRPALVLADEPTGNLDSTTAVEILAVLADVRERFGTTLIIATHDPTVAASCDSVVEICDGKIYFGARHAAAELDEVDAAGSI